ncbi:hypothetical protein S40288_02745 [Stachybotrys chartarum IBT 40288]|nr:hypothetical protein S40288_02745 [Stachybotrys chartarum IBT 40288]
MPLCDLCLGIDFAALAEANPTQHLRTIKTVPYKFGLYQCDSKVNPREVCVLYHESVESLKSSAKACDLCRLVLSQVEPALTSRLKAVELNLRYPVKGFQLWITNLKHFGGFNVLGIQKESSGRFGNNIELLASVRLCVEDESLLSQVIKGRIVTPSPTHPRVWDKVRAWLDECKHNHHHELSDSQFMPTRLLEVGKDTNTVCLRVSEIPFAEYTCLSHCWGTSRMRLQLTGDTLSKLTAGIDANELPQTFQDAVWVTRQLGIRYIWIDSLCIVQDSREDWTRESSLMGEVYKNSAVTLAADRATGSNAGFLGDRPKSDYVPVPFRGAAVSGKVLALAAPLRLSFNQSSLAHIDDEPLSARGWTLQERCLSRRILHFCHSQIIFECETHAFEEMLAEMHADYVRHWKGLPYRQKGGGGLSHSEWVSLEWQKLLSEYSKRKLTFARDKFPALAGLATHLSLMQSPASSPRAPSNKYLAGLWSTDMLRGLCWQGNDSEFPNSRPDQYRAPSWSWASIDGMIGHFSNLHVGDLAYVRNAHVDLESSMAPCGQVTGGWLHLRAIKLRLYQRVDQDHEHVTFCHSDAQWDGWLSWDVESYRATRNDGPPNPSEAQVQLIAVPLRWQRKSNPATDDWRPCGPFCLVLKPLSHRHTISEYKNMPAYQRVGTLSHVQPSSGAKNQRVVRDWIESKLLKARLADDLEDVLIL